MRPPGIIPDSVRLLQREVSNPTVSAWVAANAGSGKTHVLVQRVINLLLDGVEPEKILCITFTKAAAANMAKRVFDTLAEWTTLDDAGLDKAIRERSSLKPDAARRALARRLFARALDTPGGLKVHTIHAFCTQLLHQFPFEANVAARFNVLDDAEHTQILEQLTLDVLLEGADAPDDKLGRALAAAMVAAADQTFRDVVREAIAKRGTIMTAGDRDTALANLSTSLGVYPSDDAAKIEAEYFSRSLISQAEWPALAKTLAQGSKTDVEQARRFAGLAALPDAERVTSYLQIFCTGEGTPRKSIVTKAITDAALVERL
jgi:ATP-dependent helicase/nuclease subunit A